MSEELREYYNNKYKSGNEYHGLYGNYNKEGGGIAAHYNLCALYIDSVLQGKTNNTILEIGCGTGALLWSLRDLGYKDIQGVDIADAAKNLSILPEITLQGEASKLNFQDKSFDLVVSIGTIEHLPIEEIELSFKEIVRVGGKAILWIDKDKGNSDHIFNQDEDWWMKMIIGFISVKSIIVDKEMKGGSNCHPILINF